jgi:hypothetical protein
MGSERCLANISVFKYSSKSETNAALKDQPALLFLRFLDQTSACFLACSLIHILEMLITFIIKIFAQEPIAAFRTIIFLRRFEAVAFFLVRLGVLDIVPRQIIRKRSTAY